MNLHKLTLKSWPLKKPTCSVTWWPSRSKTDILLSSCMATTEQPEEGPARIGVVEVVEGHGGDGSEAKALHCAWATDGYSVSTVSL